jgi:hypothetical protein
MAELETGERAMTENIIIADCGDFEETTTECGIVVSGSRYVDHYEMPPKGDGWKPIRWRGEIKANGDPRFSVTWQRRKGSTEPTSMCVSGFKFYFGNTYADEVQKAVAAVNSGSMDTE